VLTHLQPPDSGGYSVVISNTYGMVTSAVALVNVGVRPTVSDDPKSQIVLSGSNVTLQVSATGSLPLSYRWRRILPFSTNYPVLTLNASNSTFALPNVQLGDAGTFRGDGDQFFGPPQTDCRGRAATPC